MLVLTRKEHQVICIGDEIRITIIDVRRSDLKVRVGIEAPDGVPVHRLEVYEDLKSGLRAIQPRRQKAYGVCPSCGKRRRADQKQCPTCKHQFD